MEDTGTDQLSNTPSDGPPTLIPQYDVDLMPILRDLGDKLFEEVWFSPIQTKRIEGKNICVIGTLNKKFRILADPYSNLVYLMKPTDSKVPFATVKLEWDEDRISDRTFWIIVAILSTKGYTRKTIDVVKYINPRKINNYYE